MQPVEAVELYREVMRSVEEHKSQLRTDDLQQLHAMFNLQEVLATKPLGVAPTLRDHQLAKQVDFLIFACIHICDFFQSYYFYFR